MAMAPNDPSKPNRPAWTPLATGLSLSLTCIAVMLGIVAFVAVLKWIDNGGENVSVKATAPGGMGVEIKREIVATNADALTQVIKPIQDELAVFKAFKDRVEAADGKSLSQAAPPPPTAPAQPSDVIPQALADAVLAGDKDLYNGASGFMFVGSSTQKVLTLDGSPVDPEQIVAGKTYTVRLTVTLREAMPSTGDSYFHSIRAKGLAAVGKKVEILDTPRAYQRRAGAEYWAPVKVIGS